MTLSVILRLGAERHALFSSGLAEFTLACESSVAGGGVCIALIIKLL